jgi:hypothetical protein
MAFKEMLKELTFQPTRSEQFKMRVAWAKSAQAHSPKWKPIDEIAKAGKIVLLRHSSKPKFVVSGMYIKGDINERWVIPDFVQLECSHVVLFTKFDEYMELPR